MVVAPLDRLRSFKKMVSESRKTVLIVEKQPNYTQLLVKQIMFAGLRPVIAVLAKGASGRRQSIIRI